MPSDRDSLKWPQLFVWGHLVKMSHVCFEIEHDFLLWVKERKRRLIFKYSVWNVGFTKDCSRANDAFCAGYHFPLVFQGRWGHGRHWSFQVWLALQGEFQQHREQYRYCPGKDTPRLIFVSAPFLDTRSFGHSTEDSHLQESMFHVIFYFWERNMLFSRTAL